MRKRKEKEIQRFHNMMAENEQNQAKVREEAEK